MRTIAGNTKTNEKDNCPFNKIIQPTDRLNNLRLMNIKYVREEK